jgi:hypothetical protein
MVLSLGVSDEQVVSISVWQTPTEASRSIIESVNPIEAYMSWALWQYPVDDDRYIYAPDDIFEEGPPIGTVKINYGEEHVKVIRETISGLQKEGYEIFAKMW